MRAVIIQSPLHMELGEWETPVPQSDEVLVSVGAAGLCAGDMYFYLGHNPYAHYPQICGHEIAGTVVAVGQNVQDIPTGARVAVEPFIGCGRCYPCRMGKSNCCVNLQIIGVHKPGGYAEYLTAPATHVHLIPESLSLVDASFAEPVAVAIQACRRANVGAEDVWILGCGPIGLALIEVAQARGARVFATDRRESHLQTAARLGAEVFSAADLADLVKEQTRSEGAPVVIEATGNVGGIRQAASIVAAGGRVVVVSLIAAGIDVSLPALDLTRKEMTILGTRASVNCFPEAIELLSRGVIRYPQVATAVSLWSAPSLFQRLAVDKGLVQKAVLVVDD